MDIYVDIDCGPCFEASVNLNMVEPIPYQIPENELLQTIFH